MCDIVVLRAILLHREARLRQVEQAELLGPLVAALAGDGQPQLIAQLVQGCQLVPFFHAGESPAGIGT